MGAYITNPEALSAIIGEIANDVLDTSREILQKEGHIVTGNIIKQKNSKAKPENKYTYEITYSAPYALGLEYGTKAHLIEAKPGKFLRFPKPAGSRSKKTPIPGNQAFEKDGYIFSKKVRHPGTAPVRFLSRALQEVKSKWQ